MNRPKDDELILYLYGELAEPAERRRVAEAVAASPEARARLDALRRLLAAIDASRVPERHADYGARVWARLAPRLRDEPTPGGIVRPLRRRAGPAWRAWALPAAATLLLAAGFLAGRLTLVPATPHQETAAMVLSAAGRQRVLAAALSRHLEGSQRLLLDLANAGPEQGLEPAGEREWAATLLAANRLYRQAARRAGQARIAALLEELEPILLELAHSPAEPSADDLTNLRERIEERDLLFKLRVTGDRIAAPPGPVRDSDSLSL